MATQSLLSRAADFTNDGFATGAGVGDRSETTVDLSPPGKRTTEGVRRTSPPLSLIVLATMTRTHTYSVVIDEISDAERLRAIQRWSGLDWGTIARTLGVSRRSVHLWLANASMSAPKQKRVRMLYFLIARLHQAGSSAADVNHELTRMDEAGRTHLSKIREELLRETGSKRQGPGPAALLGGDPADLDSSATRGVVDASFASDQF